MTNLNEGLQSTLVDTVARRHYEQNRLALHPQWDALPVMVQHQIRESTTDVLAPAFPVIAEAIEREANLGMEHAAVLRGRIEMFINDLQGRGDGVIAAELEQIINAQMED